MIKQIRNWFWMKRVREAVKYLWEHLLIERVIGERGRGTLETCVKEGAYNDSFIITVDGKPVCEIERLTHRISYAVGGESSLEFKRFNYGYWTQQIWDAYQADKREVEAQKAIIKQALFEDMFQDLED